MQVKRVVSRTMSCLILMVPLLVTAFAHAQSIALETQYEENADAASLSPWRMSSVTFRNEFSALSLDRSHDLTYNPFYEMSLWADLRWWFGKTLYVRGATSVSHELTNSDTSTKRGETLMGDTRLIFGASKYYTIPYALIDISSNLSFSFPTSKASQADTLVVGVAPGFTLAREFDVFKGLRLTYGLTAYKYFHRYTTGERESPLINVGTGSSRDADSFLSTGVRNGSWRLANMFDASLNVTNWLAFDVTAILMNDWLYATADKDGRISYSPQRETNKRYAMWYVVDADFRIMPSLSIGVGTSTYSGQLAPDSTRYAPFFNRNTNFYVELRLDIDGLVGQIKSKRDSNKEKN